MRVSPSSDPPTPPENNHKRPNTILPSLKVAPTPESDEASKRPAMALASDDSPFVKFLGTNDNGQEPDQNGIELEPAVPPEPPTDEGGDGVPYLIERTMQDRLSESLSFSNIHKYAREGNSQALEQLLTRNRKNHHLKRKINGLDIEKLSPLHYAARYNHLDCVRILVEIGSADVHVVDDEKATPLHHAARYRRKKTNKALAEKILQKARRKNLAEKKEKAEQEEAILQKARRKNSRNEDATDNSTSQSDIADVAANQGNEEEALMADSEKHHVRLATMSKAISSWTNHRMKNSASMVARLLAEEEKPTAANSVILYLTSKGAIVNQQDFYGCTPLHYAAMRGNEVAAQQLLLCKDDQTIEIEDNEMMTPLHLACSYNQPEIARMLLEAGAQIRVREESGFTPLHLAAAEGAHEIVSLLFQQAERRHKWQEVQEMLADVDNEMSTALHVAVDNGSIEVADICIEKGADVNKLNSAHESPIHLAANFGNAQLVELLIRNNARIDALDDLEQTALHKAASRNHSEVVELLLQNDADLERNDKDSYTPLLLAAVEGHCRVIELLLSKSADIFATDLNDKTAIYLAAEQDYPDALKMLLDAAGQSSVGKTLVDSTDKYNHTPMHEACRKGFQRCCELLLEFGADVDAKNEEEITPLHLAAMHGRTNIVKMLIRQSHTLVFDEDEDSNTPLHHAASRGHAKVVQLLLDNGADIDARNSSKWTPLDCAAAKGNLKAAKVLLENDSPVDPTDKSKVTPLYLACKNGHDDLVELLLSWQADVSVRTVCENEDDPTHGSNALDACIDNGHKNCALTILKSDCWEKALRNDTTGPNKMRDTPIRKLIRKMPDIAEDVFMRCCENNKYHPDHPKFKVTFNYEFLDDAYSHWGDKVVEEVSSQKSGADQSDLGSKAGETVSGFSAVYDDNGKLLPHVPPYTTNGKVLKNNSPLMIMVDSQREDLLAHPLISSLLLYKWNSFGRWVYYLNLLIYVIFLSFITVYMVMTDPPFAYSKNKECNTTFRSPTFCEDIARSPCGKKQQHLVVQISKYAVLALAAFMLLKELVQLWVAKLHYLDLENIMEWSIYVLCFITVLDVHDCQKTPGFRMNWQWQTGALGIFLAWLNLVLFLRKVPRFGIYVVMFTDVLMTFARFFIVFFLFMLAFAFGFYVLMQNHIAFKSVGQSMLKTSVMMIGEFEFEDTFNMQYSGNDESKVVYYNGVTYTLFVFFLIIMSIIIMNLLVGLAVDDIKAVQEQAALKRMGMLVELALGVESMLPQWFRRRFVIKEKSVRPNRNLNFFHRFISDQGATSGHELCAQLNPELDNIEKIQEAQDRMENVILNLKQRIKNMKHQNERVEGMLTALMEHLNVSYNEQDAQEDEI